MEIRWEALFIENSNDPIYEIISNFETLNKQLIKVENYHITTEYMPNKIHHEFYGKKVKVNFSGFVYDNKVNNSHYDGYGSIKGFVVENIDADDIQLKKYLTSLDKRFHMTTSFLRVPVDMNFADFNKIIPYNITVNMVFGGFDVENKKIILTTNV